MWAHAARLCLGWLIGDPDVFDRDNLASILVGHYREIRMSSRPIRWKAMLSITVAALWVHVAAAQQSAGQSAAAPQQSDTQQTQRSGQRQQRASSDRRTRRDRMDEVQVTSPDGRISLVVLPNAD